MSRATAYIFAFGVVVVTAVAIMLQPTPVVTIIKHSVDTVRVKPQQADTILVVECPGHRPRVIHYRGPLDWYVTDGGTRLVVTSGETNVFAISARAPCTVSRP